MDKAIAAADTKAVRDFSTAWSTFAKQADLDTMIAETRTDDITTVSELYKYMEDQGYVFHYYDGASRDEVDKALADLKASQRDLILEATGLQPLLEEMARKRAETKEEAQTKEAISQTSLQQLMQVNVEETDPVATESDEEAASLDFSDEKDNTKPLTIERSGGK